jgi:sulfatase modifying factor 1
VSRACPGVLLVTCLMSCSPRPGPRPDAVPGTVLRDCEVCPEMIVVPAGTGRFGSLDGEPHHRSDEGPARTVTIARPFAVSRYEITRGEYEAFVRATGRPVLGDCLTDRARPGTWVIDASTTLRDPGFVQDDRHPVACVSWEEARAYAAWLADRTGRGYRLLAEDEWEYVARAGTTTAYPWSPDHAGCAHANGFDQTALAHYADMDTSAYPLFDPMACSDGWLNTAPIGSLAPGGFGVFDMLGNVAEWVDGCHAPTHDAPPAGACRERVAKGGSWGSLAHILRPADRVHYPGSHRDDSIGIRVARAPL